MNDRLTSVSCITLLVVEYLCGLMDQTEINTRTNGGIGATPLWVSHDYCY